MEGGNNQKLKILFLMKILMEKTDENHSLTMPEIIESLAAYDFNWAVNKKQVLRKDGALYQVSPWALSWDDENYYLVAFDSAEDKIKHFRVDKMLRIGLCDARREGKKNFQAFDMGSYAKKMFGMFAGEEEMVKILCRNEFAGVMIDRFGKDVTMVKVDEEHFYVTVKVSVSKQFLAWVIGLGDGVKIVGPERVVEKVKEEIERLVKQYM